MSIRDEIRQRIKAHLNKRLFTLPPLMPGDPVVRTLIVSQEVRDCVTPPWPGNWEGHRHGMFRGTLDAFTRGETISVSENPRNRAGNAFLARVEPVADEVWDIRSIDPRPGIRCFGAFGDMDLFIALTWEYRENLCGGADWDREIQTFESEWVSLFGSTPRFKRRSLNEYLTRYYAV